MESFLNRQGHHATDPRLLVSNAYQPAAIFFWVTGRTRVDIFVSFEKYVWGKNTLNGQAYTVGSTWYFDRSKL